MEQPISRRSMLLRVFCFIAILGVLLSGLSYFLTPKTIVRDNFWSEKNARGFLAEPDHSLDIIGLGHSSLYAGFSPLELWNAYGYTSYAASQPHQSVQQSYELLKEAFAHQTPKLVILETDMFIDGIWDLKEADTLVDHTLQNLFPVLKYHNRWKSLDWGQLAQPPEYDRYSPDKGYRPSSRVGRYRPKSIKDKKTAPIPLITTMYLNKILSLCEQNQAQVLMVQMPINSWTEADHKAVADIASARDIPFIDFKQNSDLIKVDWHKDFRDSGRHLNDRGAKKTTLYLGEFIKEHYALTDHRKDKRFAQWDQDYQAFLKGKKAEKSKAFSASA